MRSLLLFAFLFSSSLTAQNLQFYIDNSGGGLPTSQLAALPALFNFPDTPVGGSSTVMIRVLNAGSTASVVNTFYVGATAGSSVRNPNFTATSFVTGATLAPGATRFFNLNFTPSATGALSGYLQVQVDGVIRSVSTLTGNGTAAEVTLSCSSSVPPQCDGSILQPSSASPINFGNTLTTAATSIPFTLTNNSNSSLNPSTLVSISVPTNNPNTPFALGTLPSTLDPGTSVTFNVTFAPGTANTYQTNLIVGSNVYPVQGSGIASTSGDISSLVITYTDSTGVRLTAQPASPINFGQTIFGANSSSTFTFVVSNPQTTISAVSLTPLSVTGAGFSITSGPTIPASIAPGSSVTFKLVFTPSGAGAYNGILAVGTRQFSVSGQSIASSIPDPSFQLDVQPLVNQKQANLTLTFPTASDASVIGTLTMSFQPSVSGASDDPAVVFTATGGRQLQLTLDKGATVAKYSGQSSITFQSGTTAGTLTFTLSFPNKAPYSQSFTITHRQVQITSSKALRQAPSLVITLTGYDNTYTLGQLGFTFYDTAGKAINSKPIAIDAGSSFKQFFFTNNTAGGAFSIQAVFPVVGDVTQVGSVAVGLTNSSGTTSVTPKF